MAGVLPPFVLRSGKGDTVVGVLPRSPGAAVTGMARMGRSPHSSSAAAEEMAWPAHSPRSPGTATEGMCGRRIPLARLVRRRLGQRLMDAAIRRIVVPAVGHVLRQACETDRRDGGVLRDVVLEFVGCHWRHWHGRCGHDGCRGSSRTKRRVPIPVVQKNRSLADKTCDHWR